MGDVILPFPAQPDLTDRKILFELGADSRRSLGEIARRVHLSKQTLHYRMARLVGSGVIFGFITTLDISRLGYSNYDVWIQLSEPDRERKKGLLDSLSGHDHIRYVAECSGKFDIVLGILAQDAGHFNSILMAILRGFPGFIRDYQVCVSYEMYRYSKNALLPQGGERIARKLEGKREKIELDEADKKILGLLSKNSRMETLAIAKKALISPNTVRAKMKRLEGQGVITGYSVVLQDARFFQNYEFLITLQNMDEEKEKEIEAFCMMERKVIFLMKVIGRWDVSISLDCEGSADFQDFMIRFRSRFADIIKDFEFVQIMQLHKYDFYPMG